MMDVADNFAFGGVAIPAPTFNGFTNFNSFDLRPSTNNIDRTPSGGSTATTSLVAVATTPVGAANPLSRVYYFFVHPGRDGAYDTADDYNVLIGTVDAGAATVLTGETVREFRFTQALSTSALPAAASGFDFRVFAVGVASDGDAVMTDLELIDVVN
jgi:hypothetical protein